MKFIRQILFMQTVRERAERELGETARAIFEAEKALQHKRHEIAYLRKRQAHLYNLTVTVTA